MGGFLKFFEAGIIDALPKIIGVQSAHANPVYRYYLEEGGSDKGFIPVTVQPSVAQAAMIGNPVSMPRVIEVVRAYNRAAGEKRIHVVEVREQEIMDSMIIANRNGNIACTQGGESMAGLAEALRKGYVTRGDVGILDSTAHMLKFLSFQDMYFEDRFGTEFEVTPKRELQNAPVLVRPDTVSTFPEPGKPLDGEEMERFVTQMAREIAEILGIKKK
jgi:threonine synthase